MDGMNDSFYLAQSKIVIDYDEKNKELTIKSIPTESTKHKYGIHAVTNWGSSTSVTLSKKDNTDLISSADVGVTDTRTKTIGELGGIVVKIIAAAVGFTQDKCTSPGQYPLTLNPIVNFEEPSLAYKDSTGCFKVTLKPAATDAIPTKVFTEQIRNEKKDSEYFFYSSCRDAQIIYKDGDHAVSTTVRIADPSQVQRIKFPQKGSISMHSECGVSIKMENAASDNTLSVIDALAAQTKAIQDALKKQ